MRIRTIAGRMALAAGLALAAAGASGCSPEAPVAPVPTFTSHEQISEAMAACLREKGWDARIVDGAVATSYPNEQDAAFTADAQACTEALGLPENPVPTDRQLRALYDGIVEGAGCLEAHGYIAGWDPPSYETFLSHYQAGVLDNPWDEVAAHEAGDAFRDCPPPRVL